MRPRLKAAAAIACLLAFLLARTMAVAGVVVCQDAAGARLEWGCNQQPGGDCPHDDEPSADHDAHAGWTSGDPCRDLPIADLLSTANTRPLTVSIPHPLPVPVLLLPVLPSAGMSASGIPTAQPSAQPRRATTDQLRTIIQRV